MRISGPHLRSGKNLSKEPKQPVQKTQIGTRMSHIDWGGIRFFIAIYMFHSCFFYDTESIINVVLKGGHLLLVALSVKCDIYLLARKTYLNIRVSYRLRHSLLSL